MLCASVVEIGPCGSGEEDENVKSLRTDGRTDRETDDGRHAIRKAHLSFQLRWANYLKKKMFLEENYKTPNWIKGFSKIYQQ